MTDTTLYKNANVSLLSHDYRKPLFHAYSQLILIQVRYRPGCILDFSREAVNTGPLSTWFIHTQTSIIHNYSYKMF